MDNANQENIRKFIDACRQVRRAFDVWVDSCGEEELKNRFRQMSLVLAHVDAAIEKAEKLLEE